MIKKNTLSFCLIGINFLSLPLSIISCSNSIEKLNFEYKNTQTSLSELSDKINYNQFITNFNLTLYKVMSNDIKWKYAGQFPMIEVNVLILEYYEKFNITSDQVRENVVSFKVLLRDKKNNFSTLSTRTFYLWGYK